MRELRIPIGNEKEEIEAITIEKSLVILGTNGSGKSKLAQKIGQINNNTFIITARRLADVGISNQLLNYEDSISQLSQTTTPDEYSIINGQNNSSQTMSALMSEHYNKIQVFRDETKLLSGTIPTSLNFETKFEKVIRLWNLIYPNRTLFIDNNSVYAKSESSENKYISNFFSDGEKSIFLLLSQALLAPDNCLIIIDEPENHFHQSLLIKLWDIIEIERADCHFVYVTHNVEFSKSRYGSYKIWVQKFIRGNRWLWTPILQGIIPEDLLILLNGSSKPVLFVEGNEESLDFKIYKLFYSNFSVVPRTNCEQVITTTIGVRSVPNLHSLKVAGLIDRDYRTDEEILSLNQKKIFTIEIGEVENLLLSPELIKFVCENQSLNYDAIFPKIVEKVMNRISNEFDKIVSFRTSLEINFKLNSFDTKQIGIDKITKSIDSLTLSIDVAEIYNKYVHTYNNILKNKDYLLALKNYTNKGLINEISTILQVKSYPDLILRKLETKELETIKNGLKTFLPDENKILSI